jgi:methionine salvage enolase-phosphatase E1
MKKNIYQLACFLQNEENTNIISTADLQEDIKVAKEEILSLLAEKIGKMAAEDKLNNLTTSVYDQGYIDGIRAGAQLIRLITGDTDTIKITA